MDNNLLAVFVACFSSIISILALYESKRNLTVQTVTSNRIHWMESMRELLSEFAIAYKNIENDQEAKEKMQNLEIKILMYVRNDKPHNRIIMSEIRRCCESKSFDEKQFQQLILTCQYEIARPWLRMKAEAKIGLRKEKEVNEYIENDAKLLLDMRDKM